MAVLYTFNPSYGSGITVAPGAASSASAIDKGTKSLCLTNLGSVTCYVRVGSSPVVASVADYPVVAGSQVTITKYQDHDEIAYISPGGAGSLHIMTGEGF